MNITQFAIERNRLTFTLLFVVVLLGLLGYKNLSRDSMPPYTVRVANVVTEFPGASPERVELLVTDKIEKISQELPELKEVASTSRTGISVVSVTLKDEVDPEDLQEVWDRLRRKLDSMQELPEGVDPTLRDDGIGEVYGIIVGLTSDGFSYAQMKAYADDLRDDFIKLGDAAKVELEGVQEERVFVEFDNTRLREYGLTAGKLQSIIASTNIISSGGEINLDNERIILEPTGNFDNVEDIKSMLIPVGDGSQLVELENITKIRKGYVNPSRQRVRVDGRDAISIHINLEEGANIIHLGEEVDGIVSEWQAVLPVGLELKRISSLDDYIDFKIRDFIDNLVQAILIVLAVMLLFLGLRTGSIIASLIPIVTIMTLMLMGMIHMGLNQVTLAALIMALGMMVDNAIVVAESIMVKMEQGMQARQAAIRSCSELFTPLLISTLTTSAAFLAFYMAESIMGDIVGPIFVVISLALLSSWLVAFTVITLLSYLFLKVAKKGTKKPGVVDRIINWLKIYYKDLMLFSLANKWKILTLLVMLFFLSIYGFTRIEFVFFPDSDRNMITVDINLPLGTKIERTSEIVKSIESYIRDSLLVNEQRQEGIVSWSSYIGEGPESYDLGYAPDEANSSYAHMLVNTSHAGFNNAIINQMDYYCFNNFPSADIKIGPLGAGGGGVPIEIKISGDHPDVLAGISKKVKQKLAGIEGTKNVKDDWGPKSKKFVIDIDQSRAQAAGVSNQDIAVSLMTMLDGFQTGEYREDDKSIPVIMRGDASQQQSLESLETLNIYAQNTGKSVPLLQVAGIVPEWQYSKYMRLNLIRTINITSELRENGNAAEIVAEITPWIDRQKATWPAGYDYQFGGDAKNTSENMGAVVKYLPLSGFIIVLLLVIQLNSFRKTILIISTMPLAIIGVVLGLLVFREAFGFMPFLGVISLLGIVINNAIVLIDRIDIEQNVLKKEIRLSIISACLQRFRPILLATFTTVFGLLPLYLSGGEMWEGMAISIMTGLLFGTIITLIYLPSFYSILYKVNFEGFKYEA
ncbi:MAG: efflux RND transporter permease subunit [Cytophagales bacterium]|nr:efflux RND transporter permease subunit [Cytophagales bacterium]